MTTRKVHSEDKEERQERKRVEQKQKRKRTGKKDDGQRKL